MKTVEFQELTVEELLSIDGGILLPGPLLPITLKIVEKIVEILS